MLHAKKHSKRIGFLSLLVLGALVVLGTLLGAATHQPQQTTSQASVPQQQPSTPETPLPAASAPSEAPQPEAKASFVWPVPDSAKVSANMNAYPGHTGIDIAAPKGTEIVASAAGVVVFAREEAFGYGKHLLVDHGGGYQTLYAQCSQLLVEEGDIVSVGQAIATVGRSGNSTGNHLHFEIRLDGSIQNPEDFVEPPQVAG